MKAIHYLFCLAVMVAAVGNGWKSRGGGPPPRLELRLTYDGQPIHAGDTKEVRAVVTNHGPSKATLVLPGDGSYTGRRTPLVHWSIVSADSATSHSATPTGPPRPDCGNMDPLTPDQVYTLQPGQSRELATAYLPRPGTYRVVFNYRNAPALEWLGVFEDIGNTMARVSASTPCALVSNEIIVRVR